MVEFVYKGPEFQLSVFITFTSLNQNIVCSTHTLRTASLSLSLADPSQIGVRSLRLRQSADERLDPFYVYEIWETFQGIRVRHGE